MFSGLAGAWFGHLWSLAVEEQFYFVAPLVVRFTAERYLKWILVVVILCVPLLRLFLSRILHVQALQITGLMFCRADALAIGMLAATLTRGVNPVLSVAQNTRTLYFVLSALSIGVLALWAASPQSTTLAMQSFGFTWMALFYVVILLLAVGYQKGWIAGILPDCSRGSPQSKTRDAPCCQERQRRFPIL